MGDSVCLVLLVRQCDLHSAFNAPVFRCQRVARLEHQCVLVHSLTLGFLLLLQHFAKPIAFQLLQGICAVFKGLRHVGAQLLAGSDAVDGLHGWKVLALQQQVVVLTGGHCTFGLLHFNRLFHFERLERFLLRVFLLSAFVGAVLKVFLTSDVLEHPLLVRRVYHDLRSQIFKL